MALSFLNAFVDINFAISTLSNTASTVTNFLPFPICSIFCKLFPSNFSTSSFGITPIAWFFLLYFIECYCSEYYSSFLEVHVCFLRWAQHHTIAYLFYILLLFDLLIEINVFFQLNFLPYWCNIFFTFLFSISILRTTWFLSVLSIFSSISETYPGF